MENKFWFSIAAIISISLGITFFAPINEVYKGVAALPSIASLGFALFTIIRDHSTHQRNLEIQNQQQLFTIGATSHMANTVFDKHVKFCEMYLSEIHHLIVCLTKEGPTPSAMEHSICLHKLRIDYTAWLIPEIEQNLIPFEEAVNSIGANASFIKMLSKTEKNSKKRSQAIKEMFFIFKSIMGIDEVGEINEEVTVTEVKKRIREILQINEIVKIREHLIDKAASIVA